MENIIDTIMKLMPEQFVGYPIPGVIDLAAVAVVTAFICDILRDGTRKPQADAAYNDPVAWWPTIVIWITVIGVLLAACDSAVAQSTAIRGAERSFLLSGEIYIRSSTDTRDNRRCNASNRYWSITTRFNPDRTPSPYYTNVQLQLGRMLRDYTESSEDWILDDAFAGEERESNRRQTCSGRDPHTRECNHLIRDVFDYRFDGSYVVRGQTIGTSWSGLAVEHDPDIIGSEIQNRQRYPLAVYMPDDFKELLRGQGIDHATDFTLGFWAKPLHYTRSLSRRRAPAHDPTMMKLQLPTEGVREAMAETRRCAEMGGYDHAPPLPHRCDQVAPRADIVLLGCEARQ